MCAPALNGRVGRAVCPGAACRAHQPADSWRETGLTWTRVTLREERAVSFPALSGHPHRAAPPLALAAIGHDGDAAKTVEGMDEVLSHRRLVLPHDDEDVGTRAELPTSRALHAPGIHPVCRARVFEREPDAHEDAAPSADAEQGAVTMVRPVRRRACRSAGFELGARDRCQ